MIHFVILIHTNGQWITWALKSRKDSDLWVPWGGRQMVFANILQKSVWKRIIYESWHDCWLVTLQSEPVKLWILVCFSRANCSDTNLNKIQNNKKGLNMLVATTWSKSVLFISLSLLFTAEVKCSVWCVSEEMRHEHVNLWWNDALHLVSSSLVKPQKV
jgi:hypothetical protein